MVTLPRRRPQPRTSGLLPVIVKPSEAANNRADCVFVMEEDGQTSPAGTIVKPPQGNHALHGRTIHLVSESLLELTHVATLEPFACRLCSRGSPHADTSSMPAHSHGSLANDGHQRVVSQNAGGRQAPNRAPGTVDHGNEEEARRSRWLR